MAQTKANISTRVSKYTRLILPKVKSRKVQPISASWQMWQLIAAHTQSPAGFSSSPVSEEDLVSYSCWRHSAFIFLRKRKQRGLQRQESIWKPWGMFAFCSWNLLIRNGNLVHWICSFILCLSHSKTHPEIVFYSLMGKALIQVPDDSGTRRSPSG